MFRGNVGVRDVGCNGRNDIIRSAERAHNAFLGCRVLLPGQHRFYLVHFARHLRPCLRIVPVFVLLQDPVRTYHRGILKVKHIRAVLAAAGPVHQAGSFKGRRVAHLDADGAGQFPCDRFIFVSCYRAVQQDAHPQARLPRRMAPGGIGRKGGSQAADPAQYVVRLAGRDIIHI